jgi:hypothetical protein
MLNPSTATAEVDDPTIRRCINFSKKFQFGGMCVVNLYDFRATKPQDLWKSDKPNSLDNDRIILDRCAGNFVIAAWGMHAKIERIQQVWNIINTNALCIDCLGFTKMGHPRHPLMVRNDVKLQPFVFN